MECRIRVGFTLLLAHTTQKSGRGLYAWTGALLLLFGGIAAAFEDSGSSEKPGMSKAGGSLVFGGSA